MSKSLPTIDPFDYQAVVEHNNEQMSKLLEQLFPGITVSHKHIFDTLLFLQETGVNPGILPRVVRGIYNVTIGTGEGEVIIHVRKDGTNTLEVREREGTIQTRSIYDKK